MFYELVSILFAIVPEYGNKYMTKENKSWTSFKNFATNLNLNHNIYTDTIKNSDEIKKKSEGTKSKNNNNLSELRLEIGCWFQTLKER